MEFAKGCDDGRACKEFVHCNARASREKALMVIGSAEFLALLSDRVHARKKSKVRKNWSSYGLMGMAFQSILLLPCWNLLR